MHNQSYMDERIDKLAMLYMAKHYDISSMSIDEYVKTFDKIRTEILNTMSSTR